MAERTYLQAISDGLREEMRADDRVFCLGEDIGAFGGAFKVTDGFVEEFGPDRCLDTPLAESAIIGTAIGAAAEVDAATEAALAMPMPEPGTATDGVFCEGEAEPLGDGDAPWSGFHV